MNRFVRALRAAAGELFRSATIEAGANGPRWPSRSAMARPAQEILRRRKLAAERAAASALNSPLGARVVECWTGAIAGDGPSLTVQGVAPDLARRVLASWNAWWPVADAEGLGGADLLIERAVRALVTSGEAFVHAELHPDTMALALRLWNSEQVAGDLTRPLTGGARIVGGVELDAAGRRRAFYVRENVDQPLIFDYGLRRIDAVDVFHIFSPAAPGAQRGLSWLAPIASRLHLVDAIEDAILAKAQTAALFAGALYRPEGSAAGPLDAVVKDGEAGLEPGAMITVPEGFQVSWSDPPDNGGAVELLKHAVRSVATGAGMSYPQLSADLADCNYSSIKFGTADFRRRVKTIRKTLMEGQFLNLAFKRFVTLEILNGRLPAEASAAVPAWIWPTTGDMIEPAKETQAAIDAIAAGLKSRPQVVAEWGRDVAELDAEIAADPRRPTTTEGTP